MNILYSQEDIQKRIQELGNQITHDYQNKNLVVIGVLTGAFIFVSDLVRSIHMDTLECEFVKISSYGNGKVSKELQFLLDVKKEKVQGKNILIVDDIIETGKTIDFLIHHLQNYDVQDIKVCTLLFKKDTLQKSIQPNYYGFEVENFFVMGYGLDDQGKKRNYPFIAVVED